MPRIGMLEDLDSGPIGHVRDFHDEGEWKGSIGLACLDRKSLI